MRVTRSCSLEGGGVGSVVGQDIVGGDCQGWPEVLLRCKAIVSRSRRGWSEALLHCGAKPSWVEGIRGETGRDKVLPYILYILYISYILYILYISYISYIRPFLVVVFQQRHVKNLTINIAGSIGFNGQIYAQNLTRSSGERFAITSMSSNI